MPYTIVFLASSPMDKARLRVDEEAREIDIEFSKSKFRDDYQVLNKSAVRFDDVVHVLREQKPYIVHFSGHGEGGMGLVLNDNHGKTELLDNEVLTQIFIQLKGHTHCVVLNACYSEVQAQTIAEYIPYVVGMNDRVPDKVAIEFARQFYAGLGAGWAVESAFNWAKVALMHDDLVGAHIPVLYKFGRRLSEEPKLTSKQQNFVNKIFEKYLRLNSSVLILAQSGFQTPYYAQALKVQAKHYYGAKQVISFALPTDENIQRDEYFAYLADECEMQGVHSGLAWSRALRARLRQGSELFVLVTRFEKGNDSLRSALASELRSCLEEFPQQLRLVIIGGEQLAALKFKADDLSLLNHLPAESLPELCIEDMRLFYRHAERLTDEVLQEVLQFSGQHPVVVEECLRSLSMGVMDWQRSVRHGRVPAQLFGRLMTKINKSVLCEGLKKESFGLSTYWAVPELKHDLYWQNLLKVDDVGRLVWRCEWLREVGRELLQC